MPNEIRKNIRITSEMQDFIGNLAKQLKVSENNIIKMIIFNFMRGLK